MNITDTLDYMSATKPRSYSSTICVSHTDELVDVETQRNFLRQSVRDQITSEILRHARTYGFEHPLDDELTPHSLAFLNRRAVLCVIPDACCSKLGFPYPGEDRVLAPLPYEDLAFASTCLSIASPMVMSGGWLDAHFAEKIDEKITNRGHSYSGMIELVGSWSVDADKVRLIVW